MPILACTVKGLMAHECIVMRPNRYLLSTFIASSAHMLLLLLPVTLVCISFHFYCSLMSRTYKEMRSFFGRCIVDRLCSHCYTISDGCTTKLVQGMLYNFLSNEWHWSSNTSINYALHAVKRQQWLPKQNECRHKKSELFSVEGN